MEDKTIETFDDLFEPFGLEDEPEQPDGPRRSSHKTVPIRSDGGLAATTAETSGLLCPSCGLQNHAGNRHCDSCGARLVGGQMPVAPQPMLRTTAGARALIVLAGVVLAVALLALIFSVFRGESAAPTITQPTDAAPVTGPIVPLQPIRVECTTELPEFPCSALADGNPETSWNATDGGVGTVITFYFSPPVQITEMQIDNLADEGRFLRNARMRGIEVRISDRPQSQIETLNDTRETQQVRLSSIRTSRVDIEIASAYPGQVFGGQEAFNELAVQAITFYGRVTPGE
jgi:hypothetical protein